MNSNIPPWEIEEETVSERDSRYKREAAEMKLKWDARRLEEYQSAQRRVAFAAKEKERASVYGPRDLIMEAFEARMYEEARVIEVRRRQREVYERTKAFKLGKALPPKGKAYVELKPLPSEPARPEDFDISGRYYVEDDIEALKYKAPASYVSPTGPAPPARHLRGLPRAAWEDPPYSPAPHYARPDNYPAPGTVPMGVEFAKKPEPAKPQLAAPSSPAPKKAAAPAAAPAATPAAAPAAAPAASLTASGSLPSVEEAKEMKVGELKDVLRANKLVVTGKKEELLQRVLDLIG